MMDFYALLEKMSRRPEPFASYTAADLWTDEYISRRMLECHLNGEIDVSSRNTAFIDRSVEWIASRFGVGSGTRIADFGCGPGLYANRLAALGASVTGIDFSERSLEHARGVATGERLDVRYENCNYLEFETEERFDLIMLIMCDLCALSPEQRSVLLGRFRSMLRPGGAVLLDVYSLNAFLLREETVLFGKGLMDGFWAPGKYYGFRNTFRYEEEKVVLDRYTIVEPDRTSEVFNWLQYFSPEGLEEEFGGAGLVIESLMGDVAGAPFDGSAGEFAVVGRAAQERNVGTP